MATINQILSEERKQVIYNEPVTFFKLNVKEKPVMGLKTESGSIYVIQKSLENFSRFKKWEDRKATADILPIKKKINTNQGKVELARIRASVNLGDKEEPEEVVY